MSAGTGASGGGGSGGGESTGGSDDGEQSDAPPPLTTVINENGVPVSRRAVEGGQGDAGALGCSGPVVCNPATPLPTVVTLSDIASFRPTPPTQGMDPVGWAVVGLPTNFYGQASVDVVNGTLLGFLAAVRFTPVRYRWTYGDGTSAAFASGGGSWTGLRLAEFDATPTSHVYRSSGRYTAVLSVDYSAEYSFAGQPWRSIAGTLAVSAAPLSILAGEAETVLVAHSCTQNPSGPGC
ncbi:hypothetical protein WDJ51_09720 [Rathayibacter sp. YIM 133350]|uniref:PKD domain-containing protein n=1 Tax=Rathayibacter sp. YIM 133350 TaxID=3131992 RepID=UPI00307E3567